MFLNIIHRKQPYVENSSWISRGLVTNIDWSQCKVLTWGEGPWGGDSAEVAHQLEDFAMFHTRLSKRIQEHRSSPVILQRCTGRVSNDISDISNSCQDVAQLCATGGAFAARTREGVSWFHGKPVLMEVGRRQSKHVQALAESSAFIAFHRIGCSHLG